MREIEKNGNKSVVVASPPTPSYPSSRGESSFFFHYYYVYILYVFSREVLAGAVILFQRRPPSTPVLDFSCFCFPPAHFVVVVAVLVAFLFLFSVPIRLWTDKKERKKMIHSNSSSGVYRSHSFIAVCCPYLVHLTTDIFSLSGAANGYTRARAGRVPNFSFIATLLFLLLLSSFVFISISLSLLFLVLSLFSLSARRWHHSPPSAK